MTQVSSSEGQMLQDLNFGGIIVDNKCEWPSGCKAVGGNTRIRGRKPASYSQSNGSNSTEFPKSTASLMADHISDGMLIVYMELARSTQLLSRLNGELANTFSEAAGLLVNVTLNTRRFPTM